MIQKAHKKIMKLANGNNNKRFTIFPAMTNMKNVPLITEIKFLRTLMNSFAV